jgi:ABC-type oligopeptide transport system ATPase subunit
MNLQSLSPKRTNRALLVGMTGGGKSTLARELLKTRHYVVILDTKGEIDWPGYIVCQSLRTITNLKPAENARLIYQPNVHELQDWDTIERFFEWVYDRSNCTLYVDEAFSVSPQPNVLPYYYKGALTRGRSRGLEVWSGTQRPSGLSQLVLSEAENYYVFKLQLVPDSKKIEATTGISAEWIRRLPKRKFYYYNHEMVGGPYRLKLEKQYVSNAGTTAATA